jgi:hypothetical protein
MEDEYSGIKQLNHLKNVNIEISKEIPKKDAHLEWRTPCRIMSVGRSNSGKTTECIRLLKDPNELAGKFDQIYLMGKTILGDARWATVPNVVKVFKKYKESALQKLLDRSIKEAAQSKRVGKAVPKKLIILDDCGSEKIRSMNYNNAIDSLAMQCKHGNISVWLLNQNICSASIPYRENVDYALLYRSENNNQIKQIFNDYGGGDWPKFMRLFLGTTKVPYRYLTIDRSTAVTKYYDKTDKQILYQPWTGFQQVERSFDED